MKTKPDSAKISHNADFPFFAFVFNLYWLYEYFQYECKLNSVLISISMKSRTQFISQIRFFAVSGSLIVKKFLAVDVQLNIVKETHIFSFYTAR